VSPGSTVGLGGGTRGFVDVPELLGSLGDVVMNTMNHTKEPWTTPEDGVAPFATILIEDASGDTTIAATPSDDEQCRANAQRIVACINACAGIPDPSVIPEIVDLLLDLDDLTASAFRGYVRRSKLKVLRLLERAGAK